MFITGFTLSNINLYYVIQNDKEFSNFERIYLVDVRCTVCFTALWAFYNKRLTSKLLCFANTLAFGNFHRQFMETSKKPVNQHSSKDI